MHDNPYKTDTAWQIGIELYDELYDDVRLPFRTEGSTIFVDSANPSNADLEQCPHIILTSDAKWKPQDGIMTAATHPTDDDDDPISSQIREELNTPYKEEFDEAATEGLSDKDI